MKKLITIALLACTATVFAQHHKDTISTKVVDVVKSYVPTIADAQKKIEDAKVKDSLTVRKKKINYTIYSVPVASTFVPEKGKASAVRQRITREDYLDSYVGGGFGMLGTFYGDANITLPVNDNSNASFLVNHISAADPVRDVIPESAYSLSSAEANYDFLNQDLAWGLGVDLGRRMHNWYGVKTGTFSQQTISDLTDVRQTYMDYGFAGYVKLSNPYFKGLDLSVRGLSDHFDSKELNVRALPSFEVPVDDTQKVRANVILDYYNGTFTRDKAYALNRIENRWMLFGVNPSYIFSIDNFDLKLGAAIYYADANKSNESKFKAYPDVEATYTFNSDFIVNAGLRGALEQNTVERLSKANPFIAPMQEVKPTNVQADAFVGLRGKVSSDLLYRAQLSYRQYKEMPIFTTNNEEPTSGTERLAYQYKNSFTAFYDDVSDFEFMAGINGNVKDILSFDLKGQYNAYAALNQIDKTAWNLPSVRVSLFTDFKILHNLFAGLDMFYVGTRYDLDYTSAAGVEPAKLTLDGYFDLNFHVDYTYKKHWQFFLKANNLAGKSYDLWAYYPSQSVQAFVGLRYLFNSISGR